MTFRYSNSKFLTVLDPVPLDGIGWEAVALNVAADGALSIMQRVYRATLMSGSKVRNDVGTGSITIPKDDTLWDEPLPTPLTGVNPLDREFLWRFYENGILRHEFFGEDIDEAVATEADAPRLVTIAGRTTEMCLDWGVHVPAWSESQTVTLDNTADTGSFKMRFGTETTASIAHNASASAFKTAVLAGVTSLTSADIEVVKTTADGTRTWAIRFVGKYIVGNAVPPGFRPGSSTVLDGTDKLYPEYSEIEQADFYASDKPRTAASVFLDCLSRCQGRGVLPYVIPLFDAVNDAFGEPWIDNDSHEVNPGETLTSLIQRFSEMYGWEFRMLSGFRLQVAQAGFGVDVSDLVRFWLGGHQISHSLARTTRELQTRVWAQTDTNFIASSSGASTATDLTREGWVDGFAGGNSAATVVARETRKMRADQAKQRTVKMPYNVDDDHKLFDDFTYCDWVGVEDDHDEMHRLKIIAVSWSVGPENPIDFEVTFSGE